MLGRGYRELPQYYPQPGWVEHEPAEIWATQLDAARAALARGARRPARRGRDRDHEPARDHDPLGPPHRRAGPPGDRLAVPPLGPALRAPPGRAASSRWSRARTGLVLDAYFSGTKITWLLEAHPELRARAARGELAFGTVDSWLLWQLTGGRVHATDPSNASRTLCFDIRRLDWDAELAGPPPHPDVEVFPAVRPSAGVFGETVGPRRPPGRDPDGRASPGTSRPRSSARARCAPGGAKNTYGTGCFLLLNTGADADRLGGRPPHDGGLDALPPAGGRAARGRRTRSRARCSWRARPSSGSATGSA